MRILFLCLLGGLSAQLAASTALAVPSHTILGDEIVMGTDRLVSNGVPARLADVQYEPINYRSVAPRLLALLPEVTLRTRGAKEAKIYRSISPSVVLVVTEDGIGSGSVISKDGKILTNWHVVSGYEQVAVIFKPKTEGKKITEKDAFLAKVIQVDEVADLALLQVVSPPPVLHPIKLGNLSSINVGADVHAIGHPTGQSWTYTKGMVSQIRPDYEWKTEQGVSHVAKVVQTQTPISPGSSGGPLLNEKGEIIGINSFLAEGNALNFAVSVDDVKRFLATKKDRIAKRCDINALGEQRDKADTSIEIFLDLNCDGTPDAKLVTPDDVSKPIRLVVDDNGDGKVDNVIYDQDRDGKWDISFIDSDSDGKIDLVGHHPDGSVIATRVEPYTP